MTEKERLVRLMDLQNMNAKQFAEEVGIQPGTISNIMKDRNKPSLEVLQKVLTRFSQVSPEWLILGTGPTYRQKDDSQQTLFDLAPTENNPMQEPILETGNWTIDAGKRTVDKGQSRRDKSSGAAGGFMDTLAAMQESKPRKVKKITILFDDGTFQELE